MFNDPAKAHDFFKAKIDFTTGPVELQHMLEEGSHNINIVDVRAEEDYDAEHIPTAVNLPRDRWTGFDGLKKDKLNILYCYTQQCHLAATAAVHFSANGFPVMEMDGGFEAWLQHDLPVEQGHPVQQAV